MNIMSIVCLIIDLIFMIVIIMNMKYFFAVLLFFLVIMIFGDEENTIKFPFAASDTVGAILFAENCLGCHQISSFATAKPDMGYVEKLAEDIDFMIFSQASPMAHLDFLNTSELEKIARFLIYGSHIENWVLDEFHGNVIEEQGSDTCMKCHDNDKIKKVEIPGCSKCH